MLIILLLLIYLISFSLAKCLFEIQNLVNFLKKKGITKPEEQTLREIKTHFETFHSTIQTGITFILNDD